MAPSEGLEHRRGAQGARATPTYRVRWIVLAAAFRSHPGRLRGAGMCAGCRVAAGVRAVGQAGLKFAEVDVAAEEAFDCVEQAGEDAGAERGRGWLRRSRSRSMRR